MKIPTEKRSSKAESGEWTEELIVKGLKNGDESAFVQLVGRFHARLLTLCNLMIRNEFLAEDAVQEIFWRVHKNIAKLEDPQKLKSWMFRIAANYCRDVLRYQKSRPVVSIPEDEDTGESHLPPDPVCFSGSLEARDALRAVLERLPEQYRESLLLKEVVGLSYEEIAIATNSSVEAVRSRLSRGRAYLVQHLRDESLF